MPPKQRNSRRSIWTAAQERAIHPCIRRSVKPLANCLVNADCYGRQGLVIIKKRNAITMSNPGSFRIEIDAAKSGGIPAIFRVWREQGWREPVIEESFEPDRTVLSLSLLKKESSDKQVAIKSGDKGAKTAAQKIASLNILPIMLLQSVRTFPICLVLKTHAQDGCSVR